MGVSAQGHFGIAGELQLIQCSSSNRVGFVAKGQQSEIWSFNISLDCSCTLRELRDDHKYNFLANHLITICNMDPKTIVQAGYYRGSGIQRIRTPSGEYATRNKVIYKRTYPDQTE